MTLSKSYKKIMEKIEVTEEMRSRILENVQNRVISEEAERSDKIVPAFKWKKLSCYAACILLLLVCAVTLPRIGNQGPGNMVVAPSVTDCSSLNELSHAAGFAVQEITALPFEAESISYTWFDDAIAEIVYEGKENGLTLRQSKGEADNSGDYNEYEQIDSFAIDGSSVTIKGSNEAYVLAIWQKDGFSYSITLENGISIKEMQNVVKSIR